MRKSLSLALAAGLLAGLTGPARAEAAQTNAPKPAAPTPVTTQTVAKGLAHPWGLQFLPDGRMLVTERPGRLRVVTREGNIGEPVSGVPAVAARGQGGLLDVALAPDYATSGTIYLSYAEPRDGGAAGTALAKGRLALDDKGSGTLENVSVIFRQEPAKSGSHHFGSRIVFAADGSLFLTTGDRGIGRAEVQDPTSTIGKVLHLEPDGTAANSTPAKEGWDPRVWSMGHRNIQGAALDPATGKLWTVEHGARGGDELNAPERGRNYGWPLITYGRDYSGEKIGEGTAKDGLEQPIYYWDPSIATSGLALSTSDQIPAWKGNLFVGGLNGARVVRLVLDGGAVASEEILDTGIGERIRDVRAGPDGAIWVLTDDARNGAIVRISPK